MTARIIKKYLVFMIIGALLSVLFPMSYVYAATNTNGGVPGPGNGVQIRQTCEVHQLQFDDFATDIHFKLWQQEDNIDVNGWDVDISEFTESESDYGWQPEPDHSRLKNEPRLPPTIFPDNKRHAVDVNASGANIPQCTWVEITATFWLTAMNTKHIEVEWTKEGFEPRKAFPEHGWNFEWPMSDPDNPGQYLHLFCITNDDETEMLNVTQLAFNATMDWYDDLTQVDFPPSYPNITIAPGETWCTNVTTSDSLVGGHIYFKYALHGSEIRWKDRVDHPVTAPPVDMIQRFYPSVESAYSALQGGEVDIVDHELTGSLYENAINNTDICLGPVTSLDMYQFDINSNCTIPTYAGVQSPTYGTLRTSFRQAIACLVDKNTIINDVCDGFAERIDQAIPAPLKGWRDSSSWYSDGTYPYTYDPTLAATYFNADGFVQGTTPNPDYDPGHPASAEFLRVYPSNHPTQPGQDLDPLVVVVRTDDLRLFLAGGMLISEMQKAGIPVNPFYGTESVVNDKVMRQMDYHIYTGSHSAVRFPPIFLYHLYHGDFTYPAGQNYVTNENCTGQSNYPLLDQYLYDAKHTLTYEASVLAVRTALGYGWCDQVVTIPLFSPVGYYAWTCTLKGVVNAEGLGPINKYTYMNAYKTDGSPIVVGCVGVPQSMNIFYDVNENIRKMSIYNEIETPPYDLGRDQPGFITDWTVSTYVDPDDLGTKSQITYWYRPDGGDALPLYGSQVETIDARNVYASTWYMYQTPDSWTWSSITDIKTLSLIDGSRGLEVYWDTLSYWHIYQLDTPAIPFTLLKKAPISGRTTGTYTPANDGSGAYWLNLPEPVFWVETIQGPGGPLVRGVDWEIYARDGYVNEADVRIINHIHNDDPIFVDYYYADDATGHTPGNLPWGDPTLDGNPDPSTAAGYSFAGAGIYYATEYVPGADGYLSLQKNPQYWMEAPPLGEIDFERKTNGCMKIDIFDVVIAASAYGSTGGAIPSPNWFPGADLVPECCKVDIFDIVELTGKYGDEWDCPPP